MNAREHYAQILSRMHEAARQSRPAYTVPHDVIYKVFGPTFNALLKVDDSATAFEISKLFENDRNLPADVADYSASWWHLASNAISDRAATGRVDTSNFANLDSAGKSLARAIQADYVVTGSPVAGKATGSPVASKKVVLMKMIAKKAPRKRSGRMTSKSRRTNPTTSRKPAARKKAARKTSSSSSKTITRLGDGMVRVGGVTYILRSKAPPTRGRSKMIDGKAYVRKSAVSASSAPTKKRTAKKASAKKTTARKTTARKTTARKTTARKTTARKTTARKTTAKKTSAKKTTARAPKKTTIDRQIMKLTNEKHKATSALKAATTPISKIRRRCEIKGYTAAISALRSKKRA